MANDEKKPQEKKYNLAMSADDVVFLDTLVQIALAEVNSFFMKDSLSSSLRGVVMGISAMRIKTLMSKGIDQSNVTNALLAVVDQMEKDEPSRTAELREAVATVLNRGKDRVNPDLSAVMAAIKEKEAEAQLADQTVN